MKNKLRFIAFLPLLFATSLWAQSSTAELSNSDQRYLKWEDVQCEDPTSPACYRQVSCNILVKTNTNGLKYKDCNAFPRGVSFQGLLNGYSIYRLSPEKTDSVIVSIHGLWGDSTQFIASISHLSYVNLNVISLTLPGHMKSVYDSNYIESIRQNSPYAPYSEWVQALEDTLKLARHLGKNTILVGQSTGGLLATYAALNYPDLIDEIVLVEPALKVRDFINWGACASRWLPNTLVTALGSMVGLPVPTGVSVAMGCEVQKLADQIFQRKTVSVEDRLRIQTQQFVDYKVYSEVAQRISHPVLMINNEQDKVVSPEANGYFYAGLAHGKKYVSINRDGTMPHGYITSKNPHFIGKQILHFTAENLPKNNIKNNLFAILSMRVKESVRDFCRSKFSIEDCEKLRLERLQAATEVKDYFCEYTPNDCIKITEAMDFTFRFWSEQFNFRKTHGTDAADQHFKQISTENPPHFIQFREAEKYLLAIADQFTNEMANE